jgi:hypothetical protein
LALFLVGFGVAACGSTPKSRFPDADAALKSMRAGLACSRGIGGEAKIDYMDDRGRVRASMAILASLPDRTRLDAFSPFGVSVSTLTTDGGQFAYYDLEHRLFLEGPSSACNIARFTQVPMPAFALVQLLRGEAPVLKHSPGAAKIDWSGGFFGGGHYTIEIQGNNEAVENIELLPHPDDFARPWQQQRLRVTRVALKQQGIPLYEALLDDHRVAQTAPPREDPDGLDPPVPPSGPACQAEIPRSLRLIIPETERDLVVRFETLHHNPPLIAGAFRQVRPDGVTLRYATCGNP